MARWVGSRACTFVLVFGMFCGCSKPPPAPKPANVVPVAEPIAAVPATSPGPVPVGVAAVDSIEPLPAPPDGKRLVMGASGHAIGETGRARYTSGAHECPPTPGAICEIGKILDCEVHDLVGCGPDCEGYRTQYYTCDTGTWRLRETGEAACRCAPKKLPAELAACTTRYVSVQPSDHSPSDGCRLGLSCAGHDLWLECDGENDGTGTSLCECWRDRREQNIGGLYPGEGPDACFSAAAECSKAR